MIRFGLCCLFRDVDIKFRNTTAKYLGGFSRQERLKKISELCLHNASTLKKTLEFLYSHDIRAFRVNSQIMPLKTHPEFGYQIEQLPDYLDIMTQFMLCGEYSKTHDMRLSFHPDQFVVINSPKTEVVRNSLNEIEYQALVAQWINADVINIHGGGGYGDKKSALKRFSENFHSLSMASRKLLTVENDDRVYSPEDLLPLCRELRIPLVYDVHHHRCLKDSMTIEQATKEALNTWNREPLFHISSPIGGWNGKNPSSHHDYIDPDDFPACWKDLEITLEVEAKAKELAVLKLKSDVEAIS